MKKLAIIGASYLQLPLIKKAKKMGIETHVFAWKVNDVGEKEADYFYPISIVEKERILNICQEKHIDGICSIASDLAIITVNYVAQEMGLISNSLHSTEISTNKYKMRKCFEINADPSPKNMIVDSINDIKIDFDYPIIVKPTDRSGSRAIFKVNNSRQLLLAIKNAIENSFEKKAIIEEYIDGDEYSVEYITWEGKHYYIITTKKYTTGEPHFIETGHSQPAELNSDIIKNIKETVEHALDSLEIKYGASHTEIIIKNKKITIIEIGARMGGDLIGSDLVPISTGYDFVEAVINISLGIKPKLPNGKSIAKVKIEFSYDKNTTDSSTRTGYKITRR